MRYALATLVAVLLTVFLALGPLAPEGATGTAKASSDPVGSAARAVPVVVEPAVLVPGYSTERDYSGVLEARRTSSLSFLRSGLLQTVSVEEGDKVARGQLLAQLDTRELEADRARLQARLSRARSRVAELERGPRIEPRRGAKAQIRRVEAELELAREKQQRRVSLYEQGAIPREQLDEWDSRVRALEAELDVLQESSRELENGTRPEVVAQARAEVDEVLAQLQELEVDLQDCRLRAPFAGRVAHRELDEGTVVSPGRTVLQLDELGELEASVSLPQSQQPPLSAEFQVGEETFTGRLIREVPRVDQATNTRVARYLIRGGLPGQPVTLRLPSEVNEPGFWLPTQSLTAAGNGLWKCYTVDQDQVVQTERLETLYEETDRVLVRGTLEPGDRVIVEGMGQVVPGQRVAPSS